MSKTTWERTPVQNLLRNGASGRYYARWTIGGKQKWVNLKTDVFTVAKLRLADESAKVEALRSRSAAVAAGCGTVGDLMALDEQRTDAHADLEQSTKDARAVGLKMVRKTWPELERMKPSAVTPAAVAEWANRIKGEGTGYVPPGAKTAVRGNSATSVNRAIDTLRRVMGIAVERGAIHSNPVDAQPGDGRLKKRITKKPLTLPTAADVQRLFAAMENNGARGGWGIEAADFCRFMAYSGARVGEAAGVTWACVDWDKRLLHIRAADGADLKTETSNRFVPLFADLAALLTKIAQRRKKAALYAEDGKPMIAPTDPVFRISECQKTIDKACAISGIARITHHDFRHLFATRCIESGVDVPTVSRWLGHADGGALAMRTYGHLRQDHSQAQAARVSFGPTPPG